MARARGELFISERFCYLRIFFTGLTDSDTLGKLTLNSRLRKRPLQLSALLTKCTSMALVSVDLLSLSIIPMSTLSKPFPKTRLSVQTGIQAKVAAHLRVQAFTVVLPSTISKPVEVAVVAAAEASKETSGAEAIPVVEVRVVASTRTTATRT